jgi:hypothetical protein
MPQGNGVGRIARAVAPRTGWEGWSPSPQTSPALGVALFEALGKIARG